MGIFSGEFDAESGTVAVEIDGSTTIGGSGTFYIVDIGKLEFSNEVPNKDENDVTSIITKQGGLSVSVHNRLSNGNSFINYLDELNINEQLNATFSINGLNTFLAMDYRNISYDESAELVKINFRPRYIWPETATGSSVEVSGLETSVSGFYTNYATANSNYIYASTPTSSSVLTSVAMYELMQDYFTWVYGVSTGDMVIPSDTYIPIKPNVTVNPSDVSIIVPTGSVGGVLGTISRFSALDAGNFGHAFGKAYYMPRYYKGASTGEYRTEINYNNVSELTLNRERNDIYTISVTAGAGQYTLGTSLMSFPYNTLNKNSQTFSLLFSQVAFIPCYYDDIDDPPRWVRDVDITIDMLDNTINAYASSVGANAAKRINFKFRNALSIKPYQSFTLSSGAPSIFRASGASSVVYRPSRLFYDFKGDYVEGEAYAIGVV